MVTGFDGDPFPSTLVPMVIIRVTQKLGSVQDQGLILISSTYHVTCLGMLADLTFNHRYYG